MTFGLLDFGTKDFRTKDFQTKDFQTSAVAWLRPGDLYYPASGRCEKQNHFSSQAGGLQIIVTRPEPGDGCEGFLDDGLSDF